MNTGSKVDVGRPRIAITVGEPAGIGPDLVIALADLDLSAEITAIGDPELLAERASMLGVATSVKIIDSPQAARTPGELHVLAQRLANPVIAGTPDPANSPAVLEGIRRAVHGCLCGEWDALVTAPVNKAVINDAGIGFSGHTEFIGDLCGVERPVMMLTDGSLRVALVTTHLPLLQVSKAITTERVEQTLRIVHTELGQLFGVRKPHLLVCGLNPHAGEQGHLGDEELRVIVPVTSALRAEGMDIIGPVAADTAFTPTSLQGVDVVIAMYHDQGLPVLKARGFGRIVNITLGLPLIRTSVDHGTALDLAGSGRARHDSLAAAVECAARLALRRNAGRSGAATGQPVAATAGG